MNLSTDGRSDRSGGAADPGGSGDGKVSRVTAAAVSRVTAAAVARVRPGAVVLALALLSVLVGYLQKYPCDNSHADPGSNWRKACYTDVLPFYSGTGLSDGKWPYFDHELEYPVLIGALIAVVGLPVYALDRAGALDGPAHALGFETVDAGVVFYWVTAGVLGVLALVTTWALLRCRRERPWDVALWAVAPGLILDATINWDLLAVSLAAFGILAWARGHPLGAGVLIGLGAAAKFYPLLILGPLVLLCLRARSRRARIAAVQLVGAAGLAWAVVNLPVALLAPDGWSKYYRLSSERWIDWGSLWFILDNVAKGTGASDLVQPLLRDVPTLNRSSLALFALCCLGIAALIWKAPRPPRVGAMAFLVVAAFLLTNKVWSPQFVLWVLPLAVLARPRWGFFLIWQAAEAGYLLGVLRAVLGERDGYALVQISIVRWLSLALLCGLVVAEAVHPERDVVRAGGLNDPEGGLLDAGESSGPPELVPADADLTEQAAQQG